MIADVGSEILGSGRKHTEGKKKGNPELNDQHRVYGLIVDGKLDVEGTEVVGKTSHFTPLIIVLLQYITQSAETFVRIALSLHAVDVK